MTNKKSLIWEISHDHIKKGYLFGTMHVSGKVAFSNFQLVYDLIDACDCIATEIMLDHNTQREMGKHMHLPSNTSLKELLSEKKIAKYTKELNKYFELDFAMFANIMPLFLINLITQKSIVSEESLMNQSMDLECWQYAKNKGLKLDSLESLEGHINTLYSIPIEYQLKALKSSFANLPKFKRKACKLLTEYTSQDIHSLYKSSKKSLGDIKKVLLYDRNRIMADRIIEISKQHKTFFAFGAGHLSGGKGVIHLLKKEGIKVKPAKVSKLLTTVT